LSSTPFGSQTTPGNLLLGYMQPKRFCLAPFFPFVNPGTPRTLLWFPAAADTACVVMKFFTNDVFTLSIRLAK
jgi:hypothetical protein